MAVPSIPADDSDGNDWNATKVNIIYDHIAWWHGNAGGTGARPYFKGRAWSASGNGNYEADDNTTMTFGFGSAGAFNDTPISNVGGWTVASADADPESLVVPEAGIYMFVVFAEFENPAGHVGRREAALLKDGALVLGSEARIDAGDTAAEVAIPPFTVFADCAASAEIDVRIFQNSGANLTTTVYLTAIWMQST